MSDCQHTDKFDDLSFEDFQAMALDETLSINEKVGFPDAMRSGSEGHILDDIRSKLPALDSRETLVMDVGCGCSGLPRMLIERAEDLGQLLVLVDSEEMLAQLPDSPQAKKRPGYFPHDEVLLAEFSGRVEALLAYSVIQYVARESSVVAFLDAFLGLLAPGGWALIGDVPNSSMRNRFLASASGKEFHRQYMNSDEDPPINSLRRGEIDDALLIGLLMRARSLGLHAFLVPQDPRLPMANRREDLLINRP